MFDTIHESHMRVKDMHEQGFSCGAEPARICAMNIQEAFGEAFKLVRTEKALDQMDFFPLQSVVSRLENGKLWPRPDNLEELLHRLGISASDLWKRAEALRDMPNRQRAIVTKEATAKREAINRQRVYQSAMVFTRIAVETKQVELPALASMLRRLAQDASFPDEREAYKFLADQVGNAIAGKRVRFAAFPGHAGE